MLGGIGIRWCPPYTPSGGVSPIESVHLDGVVSSLEGRPGPRILMRQLDRIRLSSELVPISNETYQLSSQFRVAPNP